MPRKEVAKWAIGVITLTFVGLGCATTHDVDVSKIVDVIDFEWDGHVHVTKQPVIMLIGWRTTRIELISEDGRVLRIEPNEGTVRAFMEVDVTRENHPTTRPSNKRYRPL